uniref:Beta-1,4-galactosyltransferase n=2 Tax=Schistosoma mansoni TaxID=6183 RepID=A0A3Q0KG92_SCHMA
MRKTIIFIHGSHFLRLLSIFRCKLCMTVCVVTALFFIIAHLSNRPSRVVYTHPDELTDKELCSLPGSKVCCPKSGDIDLTQYSSDTPTDFLNLLYVSQHVCEGSWKPGCVSTQKIAVIIPYREREKHLKLLLPRLHALLLRQNMPYYVFVIEQAGTTPFNRGLLFDVGVLHALDIDPDINCFIFHDVDLLPEKSENFYICDTELRHLSPAVDDLRYHPPFLNSAGGVVAMSKKNIFKINGFPTRHWGWGSEDDEFSARGLLYNLKLTRPPEFIGRYKAPRHKKYSISFKHQSDFLKFRNYLHDGLSILIQKKIYFKWKIESLNKKLKKKISLHKFQTFKIPSFLNSCTRQNILSQINLNNHNNNYSIEIVYNLTNLSKYNYELLNDLSRNELFIHFIFDPIDLYKQYKMILKPIGNNTDESLWWYLHFYGWI